MKQYVAESLELFEKQEAAETVKQSKSEKNSEAIKGLEKQLADAQKKGQFNTTIEKNAKIKELKEKIAKFKAK